MTGDNIKDILYGTLKLEEMIDQLENLTDAVKAQRKVLFDIVWSHNKEPKTLKFLHEDKSYVLVPLGKNSVDLHVSRHKTLVEALTGKDS